MSREIEGTALKLRNVLQPWLQRMKMHVKRI